MNSYNLAWHSLLVLQWIYSNRETFRHFSVHQVWASGFSAAFLKKQSIATKGLPGSNVLGMEVLVETRNIVEPKPAVAETALLVVLEKFFEVVLNLPSVNRW